MNRNILLLGAAGIALYFLLMKNKKETVVDDDFIMEEDFSDKTGRTKEEIDAQVSQRPNSAQVSQKPKVTQIEVPKKIIVGDSQTFVSTAPSPFTVDNLINLGKKKETFSTAATSTNTQSQQFNS